MGMSPNMLSKLESADRGPRRESGYRRRHQTGNVRMMLCTVLFYQHSRNVCAQGASSVQHKRSEPGVSVHWIRTRITMSRAFKEGLSRLLERFSTITQLF